MLIRFLFILSVVACALAANVRAQRDVAARLPLLRVAVLDFGETETGRKVADALAVALGHEEKYLRVLDRAQSRAAAHGSGYAGSLNLSLTEARDLGAAIDCDFFITGDAQTLRRSSSARPVYYEAYASIFIVSARTGRLVRWQRTSEEAATPNEAEKRLLEALSRPADAATNRVEMARAQEDEYLRRERELTRVEEGARIEDEPEEGSAAAVNYRPPQPFRRLRPLYTETAERAAAEATIDASVEIDAEGEVRNIEIVRWAGFGLDESVTDTVRRLHFRPAMRDGVAFPVRVLLRYNFRRPPQSRQSVPR